MFTGEFKLNLKKAIRAINTRQYGDAYVCTNEPIEKWLQLTPVKNPRILTVAASGDQPLLYAAMGASHIDTFDITIKACAIMDFKTTALQNMDYSKYLQTVNNLNNLAKTSLLDRLGFTSIFKSTIHTANKMPERTRSLMKGLISHRQDAFFIDKHSSIFPQDEALYAKMQQTVKKPFNFIWTDLINLSHHLHNTYDIINLSNIFDHYQIYYDRDISEISKTINKLWSHLNTGGYILCTTSNNMAQITFPCILAALRKSDAEICLKNPPKNSGFVPIIIQKTR